MKMIRQGATIGLVIGLVISVLMSFMFGDGQYYPMAPNSSAAIFYGKYVSDLMIFVIALVCWILIGVLFTLVGKVFMKEEWTIFQMAAAHFLLVCIFFFPLSIASGWYPLTMGGIIQFFIIFLIVYIVIWVIMFTKNYLYIKRINEKLGE